MSETEILIYKLDTEGNVLNILPVNLLDEFISVNVIFIYFYKEKHLFIWIGQNAGKEMRKFIPQAEKQILEQNDRITILRHFTVDQNQESKEFLDRLNLDKKAIKKRADDYSKFRIEIYQEIQNFQLEKGSNAMIGKFDAAIEFANKIIETAKKVNDVDVIEEEKQFIQEMLGNKNLAAKREEATAKITVLTKSLEEALELKEPIDSHSIANEINLIYSDLLKTPKSNALKELLFQEEQLFANYLKKEEEMLLNVNRLNDQLNKNTSEQKFDTAQEILNQIFDELKQTKNMSIIHEWNEKQKQIEIQRSIWEKEQEKIRIREEEIFLKIKELKEEISKSFDNKDYDQIEFYSAGLDEIYRDSINNDLVEQTRIFIEKINDKLNYQKKLDEKINEINQILTESASLATNLNFAESIAKLKAILGAISNPELDKYKHTLETEIQRIQKEELKYQEKIQLFDNLVKIIEENQIKSQWQIAIQNCSKLIELAQYLEKVDVIPKYESILDNVSKNFEHQKQQADKEQKELLQKAKEIENIIEVERDVLPLIDNFSITDLLGNLDSDIDNMMNQLGSLLDTQRVKIKTELTSKSIIRSASGEVLELDRTTNIQQVEKSANSEGIQSEISFNVKSGLENPFNEFIEEAIIEDIIPYNFEITEIYLNGETPAIEPNKKMLKEGLQLQWVLKDIPPKESRNINYDMKRRVSRTIILPLEDQLKIIKTHTNVNQLHLEGLYDAKMKFDNQFNSEIKGAVIEDIVPQFYIYEIKQPDNINPDSKLEQSAGSLVKWNIKYLEQNHSMIHRYQLLEIFRFEDLKISINRLSNEAFEELEKGKLGISLKKYSILMKLLEDYN